MDFRYPLFPAIWVQQRFWHLDFCFGFGMEPYRTATASARPSDCGLFSDPAVLDMAAGTIRRADTAIGVMAGMASVPADGIARGAGGTCADLLPASFGSGCASCA